MIKDKNDTYLWRFYLFYIHNILVFYPFLRRKQRLLSWNLVAGSLSTKCLLSRLWGLRLPLRHGMMLCPWQIAFKPCKSSSINVFEYDYISDTLQVIGEDSRTHIIHQRNLLYFGAEQKLASLCGIHFCLSCQEIKEFCHSNLTLTNATNEITCFLWCTFIF